MHRYAICCVPPADTALWRAGTAWLGRDPETQRTFEFPRVEGYTRDRLIQLAHAARRYGFHGTLVSPFRLAQGCEVDKLIACIEVLCARHSAFVVPDLSVRTLGEFLALRPAQECIALSQLASACVRAFNTFRAPPDDMELKRRRAAGLSPRQESYLSLYGYPYVMEEFRFHMTLTDRLDEADRAALARWLAAHFSRLGAESLPVEGLALFGEPEPGAPFELIRRIAFGRDGATHVSE